MSVKTRLLKDSINPQKIWIPGASGMVGAAIIRQLKTYQREQKVNITIIPTTRHDIDVTKANQVERFYRDHSPDIVILCAAKVGGIQANLNEPAAFLMQNIAIAQNVIDGAYRHHVKKLLFLGSSCIYPKNATCPINEDALLSGTLEPSNQSYAIAKIAGLKMCQAYRAQYGCDFISVMPCNLYGPHDNFHTENAHVPAALLHRFHQAKINAAPHVVIWGSGKPLREFMHVDDMADACVFLLEHYHDAAPINIGTGMDISIHDFAIMIKDITGYNGQIMFDTTRPDGVSRKTLDISKLRHLGWAPRITLHDGLRQYYNWYLTHQDELRLA